MGASRRRCSLRRKRIPTRFALVSKATSPFQGEVELAQQDSVQTGWQIRPKPLKVRPLSQTIRA